MLLADAKETKRLSPLSLNESSHRSRMLMTSASLLRFDEPESVSSVTSKAQVSIGMDMGALCVV